VCPSTVEASELPVAASDPARNSKRAHKGQGKTVSSVVAGVPDLNIPNDGGCAVAHPHSVDDTLNFEYASDELGSGLTSRGRPSHYRPVAHGGSGLAHLHAIQYRLEEAASNGRWLSNKTTSGYVLASGYLLCISCHHAVSPQYSLGRGARGKGTVIASGLPPLGMCGSGLLFGSPSGCGVSLSHILYHPVVTLLPLHPMRWREPPIALRVLPPSFAEGCTPPTCMDRCHGGWSHSG
jgi:hypothetical protein